MKDKSFYQDAPDYCHSFFDLVSTSDLLSELEKSCRYTHKLFEKIPAEKENYSYQKGKWTIKEVIQHIIDCERVYAYRALRFSRFDSTELAGFDQEKFIQNYKNSLSDFSDLKEEYTIVRKSTLALYQSMTEEMLNFKGKANQATFTAKTLGFMVVGHNLHHCYFIEKMYLNSGDSSFL